MKAFNVANLEIQRLLKRRFIRVALITVAFMPLLYSGLYLYAFWDPYSKLDKLPVAVVNQDKERVYDGRIVNYGSDIIKDLKNNNEFKWSFIDYKTGIDGLKDKKYYFMIVIPEDFTENIISADSNNPKKANIEYITNDKKNFLATQIGNKAIENLQHKIAASVRKGYINSIFTNINAIGNGLRKASDAENKLANGTLGIYDGVKKLSNGINNAQKGSNQIKSGALNISSGLNQALSGSTDLYNGTDLLANKFLEANNESNMLVTGMGSIKKGITGINQGLNSAADGANKLKVGINSLVGGYNQAGENISSFAGSVTQMGSGLNHISTALNGAQSALGDYISKHPEAKNDPELRGVLAAMTQSNEGLTQINQNLSSSIPKIQQLNGALGQLKSAAGVINNGIDNLSGCLSQMSQISGQLADGGDKLYNGLVQFTGGVSLAGEKLRDVSNGLYALNNGIKSLSDGSLRLYNGADTLSNGMNLLNNGSKKLEDGSKKLYDNQVLLAQNLNAASQGISSSGVTEAKKDMINEPIMIDKKRFNPVANYGIGFAPYFIPLSLWVGALILFFIIDIFDKEQYDGISNVSITVGKFISICIIAILQSVISSFVIIEALKLPVNNLFYYYLTNAVMSVAFVAIIQLLVMLFGMAGRFFAIVLLMLQLTSSGGTFPMELIPRFFNIINPYMPMTYGVAALREAISGSNISVILDNILIIAGFGALFFLFTILLAEKAEKIKIVQKFRQNL